MLAYGDMPDGKSLIRELIHDFPGSTPSFWLGVLEMTADALSEEGLVPVDTLDRAILGDAGVRDLCGAHRAGMREESECRELIHDRALSRVDAHRVV